MRELGLTELNNASSLPPLYLAVFPLPTRACMILTCAHARVYEHTHTRIPPVLSAPLAFLPLFARQFRTHTPRPALYYTTTTTAPTLYTTIFYDFVKSMKNVDGFPPSLWTLVPPPPPLVRRVFVGGMEGGRNVPRSFLRF